MKDIFRKIGQGLSSLATDLPARQENGCFGQRRTRDKQGRRTRLAARRGFGPGSGSLNAQELRFHGGGEGGPGCVSRNHRKKRRRNGKYSSPSCRRPAAASRPRGPGAAEKTAPPAGLRRGARAAGEIRSERACPRLLRPAGPELSVAVDAGLHLSAGV